MDFVTRNLLFITVRRQKDPILHPELSILSPHLGVPFADLDEGMSLDTEVLKHD